MKGIVQNQLKMAEMAKMCVPPARSDDAWGGHTPAETTQQHANTQDAESPNVVTRSYKLAQHNAKEEN